MAWRSSESPMEFEYDNRVGELGSSPFARLADQGRSGTLNRNFGSSFRSPAPAFNPPERNFGSQPKSPSPVRNPTFKVPPLPATPKPIPFRDHVDTDFSSAAESSPETGGHGADSEDTPEAQRMENVTVFRGGSTGKTKTTPSRRQSWLSRFKARAPNNSFTNSLVKRTQHKRKRREVEQEDQQLSWKRPDGDSEFDDSRPSSSEGAPNTTNRQNAKKASDIGTLRAILSFIHDHPNLPTVLAFYGQMIFTLFMLCLLGWWVWIAWAAIDQQIEVEAETLGQDILLKIRQCEKDWSVNHCGDAANVPPALERMCADWDHCRNQDWKAKGRAKIGAQTFATILNNFVEPLSYKFIICALFTMALLVLSPVQLFSLARKASQTHHPEFPQNGFVPQTPSRQISSEWANGGMQSGGFISQSQQQWDSRDWGSPSKRMEGRSRSPTKQLGYKQFL